MYELTVDEIDAVNGGVNMRMFAIGFGAACFGAGLAVAGLGTPISIGGAVLAVQGGAAMTLALAM